jgi:two-component system response regulator DctR
MSGIELQQAMTSRGIRLPIIFMTGYGAIHESVQAIKAGAMDFMEKPVAPAALLRQVDEALYLDRVRWQWETDGLVLQSRFEGLSRREKEVVELVVEGRTNKEIGQVLSISYRTVEKYRAGAMVKLKVENAVELARLVQSYAADHQTGRVAVKR